MAAADSTVTKVDSTASPRGSMGQRYLASGKSMSMRLWQVEAEHNRESVARDYETVGYVIRGRAELYLGNDKITLEPGNSWVVPKGATHRYHILEPFEAVEATHPPAELHDRDRAPGKS